MGDVNAKHVGNAAEKAKMVNGTTLLILAPGIIVDFRKLAETY